MIVKIHTFQYICKVNKPQQERSSSKALEQKKGGIAKSCCEVDDGPGILEEKCVQCRYVDVSWCRSKKEEEGGRPPVASSLLKVELEEALRG